ncbi:MAG: hypothetical protein WD070_09735, partial [Pirellulaceae bacterium]
MSVTSTHRYFVLTLLATSGFFVSAAEPARMTLDLASDFPTETPTIVSGTLDRAAEPGSVFAVQHPSLDHSPLG